MLRRLLVYNNNIVISLPGMVSSTYSVCAMMIYIRWPVGYFDLLWTLRTALTATTTTTDCLFVCFFFEIPSKNGRPDLKKRKITRLITAEYVHNVCPPPPSLEIFLGLALWCRFFFSSLFSFSIPSRSNKLPIKSLIVVIVDVVFVAADWNHVCRYCSRWLIANQRLY